MGFIILLILTASAIAGSAAFFSVYGLAHIFSGTFWSVVLMGSSLEAGKLIATSFLYRHWKQIGFILKTYLILGVVSLMLLTSVGVFGYLSSGYLQDTMPLAQMDKQIAMLTDEKNRLIERKKEIDVQIAQLPSNYVRARTQLMKQFQEEQKAVTARITELDAKTLELSQQQLVVQSHVGPIIYIAKAFNQNTDDATKYLIYIIIFAFDPMAVALTLAVNISLRIRREEKLAKQQLLLEQQPASVQPSPAHVQSIQPPVVESITPQHVQDPEPSEPVVDIPPVEQPTTQQPDVESTPAEPNQRNNLYLLDTATNIDNNIQQLISMYKELRDKPSLTEEETTEYQMIENILKTHGLLVYLSDNS